MKIDPGFCNFNVRYYAPSLFKNKNMYKKGNSTQ